MKAREKSKEEIVRAFIVGCPRSGTTLLQMLLAAHPEMTAFPESGFFRAMISEDVLNAGHAQGPRGLGARWKRLKRRARHKVGFPPRNPRTQLAAFLESAGRPDLLRRFPRRPQFRRRASRAYIRILDAIARDVGARAWIEKTPDHLHFIPIIARDVPGARFLHVVRSGTDVVASLYEAARSFPSSHWARRFSSLEACIDYWLQCVRESYAFDGNPRHLLVLYEDLVEAPEETLTRISAFLGIPYSPRMLEAEKAASPQVITLSEPWKEGVGHPLKPPAESRFYRLFDVPERARIRARLGPGYALLGVNVWAGQDFSDWLTERPPRRGRSRSRTGRRWR